MGNFFNDHRLYTTKFSEWEWLVDTLKDTQWDEATLISMAHVYTVVLKQRFSAVPKITHTTCRDNTSKLLRILHKDPPLLAASLTATKFYKLVFTRLDGRSGMAGIVRALKLDTLLDDGTFEPMELPYLSKITRDKQYEALAPYVTDHLKRQWIIDLKNFYSIQSNSLVKVAKRMGLDLKAGRAGATAGGASEDDWRRFEASRSSMKYKFNTHNNGVFAYITLVTPPKSHRSHSAPGIMVISKEGRLDKGYLSSAMNLKHKDAKVGEGRFHRNWKRQMEVVIDKRTSGNAPTARELEACITAGGARQTIKVVGRFQDQSDH